MCIRDRVNRAPVVALVPEIWWVEEVLQILIEGVHVEQELGAAMVDYGNNNWVGFGYNPAKLINQDTRLNVLQCLLPVSL